MRCKRASLCVLLCLAGLAAGQGPAERTVSAEDARGMFAQATALLQDARNTDVARVPELLETAAPLHAPAAYSLLNVYEGRYKGLPEQPERAAELARGLAEGMVCAGETARRPEAMLRLARYLERGYGCGANMMQAVQWMRRAADAGYEPARVELARCLMLGRGVKKDARAAWKMLMGVAHRAPDTPKVYFYLGTICYRGLAFRVDHYNAARLFREGVRREDAACMNNLAVMFEYGQGIRRNEESAAALYREAARLGNREASSNLQRLTFKESAKAMQSRSTPPAERICNAALRVVDSLPLAGEDRARLKSMILGGRTTAARAHE